MNRTTIKLILVPIAIAALIGWFSAGPREAQALSVDIVISQVYGGGGNSGAAYKNDYIELFNRGTTEVNVDGWSVQYASSTGSSWTKTDLSGSILPGQYYLIQEAAGSGGTIDLPAPDAVGSIGMSATSGKLALVNNGVLLSGVCPSNVIDLVGYGSANCYETAAAPVLSNTTAAKRNANGCKETDDNSADFTNADPTVSPTPRNTASPLDPCAPPNTAPLDVSLSNDSVNENSAIGTLVGNLSTTDADSGDTFTYSFCGGADDDSFAIVGDALQTGAVFDYETKDICFVCIRTTDSGSLHFDKTFTIRILDVDGLELILPLDGEHLLSLPANFQWSGQPGALGYNLQVSTEAAFTSLLLNRFTRSTSLTITLPAGRILFWRARAYLGWSFGPWSEIRSFQTPNPPGAPTLLAPVNNALLTDATPHLDWSQARLPRNAAFGHYHLQVDDHADFSSPVVDVNIGSLDESEYSIPAPLDPNTIYYWRVRAWNMAGEYSAWSPANFFREAILPPALLSPIGGIAAGSRKPLFEWMPSPGAASYTIQLSANNSFTSLYVNVTVTDASYLPPVNLPAGKTFFWRVRVNGPNGPSAWSVIETFVTP